MNAVSFWFMQGVSYGSTVCARSTTERARLTVFWVPLRLGVCKWIDKWRGAPEWSLAFWAIHPLRALNPTEYVERVPFSRGLPVYSSFIFCFQFSVCNTGNKISDKNKTGSDKPSLLCCDREVWSDHKEEKSKKERKKRDSQLVKLCFTAFVLFLSTFFEQLQYSVVFVKMQEKMFGSLYKNTIKFFGGSCALRWACEKPPSLKPLRLWKILTYCSYCI